MSNLVENQSNIYDESSIRNIDPVEWIFSDPTNHIGSNDEDGILHTVRELLDNSLDETEQPSCPGSDVCIYLFLDKRNNTYTLAIKDDGRGVPIKSVSTVFTTGLSSGKYKSANADKAYLASAGRNGMGSKVVNALSEHFRVISVRDDQLAYITTNRYELGKGFNVTDNNVIDYPSHITGTLVAYEPRKDYFLEIDNFIDSGYLRILDLAYILSMFSYKTNIFFKVIDKNIDPAFWDMHPIDAWNFIEDKYGNDFSVLLNGRNERATMEYLAKSWGLENGNFTWKLEGIDVPLFDRIGYRINLYLPRIMRNTNATNIVNNVPIKDLNSSNIIVIVKLLKDRLLQYLSDAGKNNHVIEYFLNYYKLPICISTSLKYIDVKFTSLNKSGFIDREFEKEYRKMLTNSLDQVNEEVFSELYRLISKDIDTKYAIYYNKPISSKKDRRNMSAELGTKFAMCDTKDRSEAELYLVEGISASHVTYVRDEHTQAIYCIFGKPKNVVRGNENYTSSHFDTFKPYEKLSKMLNVSGNFFDPAEIQYGKIILLNDADIDGSHIRSLHIGNLSILNEKILSSGMVYLANPPLYEVVVKNTGTKYYIQDKLSFIHFCTEMIYQTILDIKLNSSLGYDKMRTLTKNDYKEFCEIVISVGEIIDQLSVRLAIPAEIVERLTYLTGHLHYPPNIDAINSVFGKGVRYYPESNVLYIPNYNRDVLNPHQVPDVAFSLDGVSEAIYEELLPILHKLRWKELEIYITTKLSDVYKNKQVTLYYLYKMFIQLNDVLQVTRQKGLGGMDAEDLYPICMDKTRRTLHQITKIGDLERLRNLMGDDVSARKQILMDRNLL